MNVDTAWMMSIIGAWSGVVATCMAWLVLTATLQWSGMMCDWRADKGYPESQ